MNYYYLDASNQPVGPLSLEEIQRRASTGQIPADTMVAPDGGNDWSPLRTHPPERGGFRFEQFFADLIGKILATARAALTEKFVDTTLRFSRSAGNWAVTIGGAIGLFASIQAAVKDGSLKPALSGLLVIVSLACAHFVARVAFAANDQMLATAPVRLSSSAVLDYFSLFALSSVVSAVVSTLVFCFSEGAWNALIPALVAALYGLCFAIVALHPKLVRLQLANGSVGQDAIGLLAFFMKTILKLVALPFFVLSAMSCASLILGFFDLDHYVPIQVAIGSLPLPRGFLRSVLGSGPMGGLVVACVLPAIAHLAFIVLSLPLDLWRALLSVPEKLDALKR